jgi:hypothetical protein
MTAAEACGLAINLTRELSETRAQRDVYRVIAVVSAHHIADLWQRLATTDARYHRALDDARRLRTQLLERDGVKAA